MVRAQDTLSSRGHERCQLPAVAHVTSYEITRDDNLNTVLCAHRLPEPRASFLSSAACKSSAVLATETAELSAARGARRTDLGQVWQAAGAPHADVRANLMRH
jgi:hypothetical protein